MLKKIGIIGFGRFGRLAVKYLKKDFEIFIYDKNPLENNCDKSLTEVDFKEISNKEIIILSVPVSSFREVVYKIKEHLKEDTLVIDVCAVKEYTCSLMKSVFPESVEILGTHPLFGPDSAGNTLKGRKIAITPVRLKDKTLNCVRNYLENQGLEVIEITPEEHDRQISRSLLLTHFIGRAMIDMDLTPQLIDTLGYERLLKILSTVKNDSWQLFLDMNRYNKYSDEVREGFLKSLLKIDHMICGDNNCK